MEVGDVAVLECVLSFIMHTAFVYYTLLQRGNGNYG